jgi:hypothetical protein
MIPPGLKHSTKLTEECVESKEWKRAGRDPGYPSTCIILWNGTGKFLFSYM